MLKITVRKINAVLFSRKHKRINMRYYKLYYTLMFYINGHFPAFDLVLDSFWVQYLAPVNFISSSRAILDPYPSFIKFKFQIWLIQSVIKNVPSVACCSNNWNLRFMYCRRCCNRSFSVAAFSKVFLSNKRFSFEDNQYQIKTLSTVKSIAGCLLIA